MELHATEGEFDCEVFKVNVKSVIFVGFLLVGVILLMGLKDETHPKWQYGRLKVVNNWSGTRGGSQE